MDWGKLLGGAALGSISPSLGATGMLMLGKGGKLSSTKVNIVGENGKEAVIKTKKGFNVFPLKNKNSWKAIAEGKSGKRVTK